MNEPKDVKAFATVPPGKAEASATPGPPPRINIGRTLDDLSAEIRRVRGSAERTVENMERIEFDLATLIRSLATGSPVPHGFLADTHEADLVCTKQHSDDSLTVQIDEYRPVRLPPYLARFFRILISPVGKSEDGLIPWKSRETIARALAEKTSRPERARQYGNKLLNDLRVLLKKAGVDPALIQSHKRKGVRFALRSGGAVLSFPRGGSPPAE